MRLVAEHASRVIAIAEHGVMFDGPPAELFEGAAASLLGGQAAVPRAARLARELRAAGWPVPVGGITSADLLEALMPGRPAVPAAEEAL
jgi:hypothetical protein